MITLPIMIIGFFKKSHITSNITTNVLCRIAFYKTFMQCLWICKKTLSKYLQKTLDLIRYSLVHSILRCPLNSCRNRASLLLNVWMHMLLNFLEGHLTYKECLYRKITECGIPLLKFLYSFAFSDYVAYKPHLNELCRSLNL